MKRTVLLAATLLAPLPLAAQTRDQPNLVLSVSVGVLTGADLWHVPAQLVPSEAIEGQTDTIFIGRRMRSGITLSAGGMYFRTPHLGYTFEIAYLDIGGEGECGAVGTFKSDSSADNPSGDARACAATQGGKFPTSMVAFQGGLTYRFAPGGTVSPYLRVLGGLGALSGPFVETTPTIIAPKTCAKYGFATANCDYTLLDARSRPSVTWIGTLAVGNTFSMAPGYNARIELRDLITSLPVATDSGTYLHVATAKSGWRMRQAINLTLGFDVILERSHRRRY